MIQVSPAPLADVIGASHAALEVSDIDRSVAFYTETLGLEIFHDDRAKGKPPNIKGLVGSFTIELAERPSAAIEEAAPKTPQLGAPCIAFTVKDAQAAFDRLRAAGVVTASTVSESRGVKYFYAYDPDSYPFELIEFPAGAKSLGELRPWFAGQAGGG